MRFSAASVAPVEIDRLKQLLHKVLTHDISWTINNVIFQKYKQFNLFRCCFYELHVRSQSATLVFRKLSICHDYLKMSSVLNF